MPEGWKPLIPSIVALAIALVAFFKESFFGWLNAPVLSLTVDHRPRVIPFLVPGRWIPGGTPGTVRQELTPRPTHWVHLAVENDGRSTARQTQVSIERLLQLRNDEWIEVREFLPMRLEWTNSGDPPKFAFDLLPRVTRRVNLAHVAMFDAQANARVMQDAKAGGTNYGEDPAARMTQIRRESLPFLHTEVSPSNGCNILEAGVYEIDLLVAAENCKPQRPRFRIDYRGGWSDDPVEFSKKQFIVTKIGR